MDLFTIPFEEGSYLYDQLYKYIKTRILKKDLKAGEKLPSKKKLAQHLNVSENTIDKAYGQLVDEGYIYALERSGFYVENIQFPFDLDHKVSLEPLVEEKEKCYDYDFSYENIEEDLIDLKSFQRSFKEALSQPELLARRGPVEGSLALRHSIQKYLFSSRGVEAPVEQIIISSGTESLYQIICQLFPKDFIFGLENPGYQRIDRYLKEADLNYVPISLLDNGLNMEELLEEEVQCMTITPSHQFPSGIIYPINKRLELLHWAETREAYIIEDDYDSEFRYSGQPIPALKSMDQNNRVIYLGSFSKSFSPSLRISYMVLPLSLMDQYEQIKDTHPCPVSLFTQEAFSHWMNQGFFTKQLTRMRTHYRKKRQEIVGLLEASDLPLLMKGTDSGLHFVLEIKEAVDEELLFQLFEEHSIKISSLSQYYYARESSSTELLIGYSIIPMEKISKGIQLTLSCIQEALL